jgi:proline iminopeptidase
MKRFLKGAGVAIGALLLLILAGAAVLYFVERGDYEVPATVVDDPALPQLKLDGYTLHAETFGDPTNPTVIVLHGGPGGDYRSLLPLEALADDYFVVFYDQRGSGLSERVPADQLSYQVMLQDVDRIVDHFGAGEPVHLVGHSWGGMLASGYLGYAPDKVAKAVLAEPGFLSASEAAEWRDYYATLMSSPSVYWQMLRAGFASMHVDGPDSYAREDFLVGERVLPLFVNHPDNPYHCPGELYDAPHWRWGTTVSNAVQGGATDADLDSLSAHASDYGKPVLFLASECNTWIGPDLQAKHADMYANAELVIIPDAGHEMVWDNPDTTLDVIRTFLSD